MTPTFEQELEHQRRVEKLGRWIIGVTVVVSVLVHAGVVVSMPTDFTQKLKDRTLEVKMNFEEEKPPEPPKPPEPEPPPPPPKPKLVLPPPPNEDVPPPPPDQPPAPPPELVAGITADSTSDNADGPAVQVGNTMYGETGDKAVAAEDVKPITGPVAVPVETYSEPVVKEEWSDGAYPEEAREANIEGVVRLQITVDATGRVTQVTVVKGLGFGLDEEAKRRIKRFKFSPALKNGQPVPVTIPFNFRFALQDE
jgi:protein TonB